MQDKGWCSQFNRPFLVSEVEVRLDSFVQITVF